VKKTDTALQVSGLGAFVLMTKSNLGLGLLGIPGVFDVVGIVPGIILIVVMASIIGCEWKRNNDGKKSSTDGS
jgi:amino acid permease